MLTDLYRIAPTWLHRRLRALLGLSDTAVHDWLCDSLGCHCPTTPATVAAAA